MHVFRGRSPVGCVEVPIVVNDDLSFFVVRSRKNRLDVVADGIFLLCLVAAFVRVGIVGAQSLVTLRTSLVQRFTQLDDFIPIVGISSAIVILIVL